MRFLFLLFGLQFGGLGAVASVETNDNSRIVIVLQGVAGLEEYGKAFQKTVLAWEKGCEAAGLKAVILGRDKHATLNDLGRLEVLLQGLAKVSEHELWIVLVGHGTFDGKHALFNLSGPDLSSEIMGQWLKPFKRQVVLIDGSASSAPFLRDLSRSDRVIITATTSADERNYTRFGHYFAEAINDPDADLDKDGEISLLEAYQRAAQKVNEFYKMEGRIATEHALLDDNGDQKGTPADWFDGARIKTKAKDNTDPDGYTAHQISLIKSAFEKKIPDEIRKQRNILERKVFHLRDHRTKMPDDEYFAQLEELLLQIAELYEKIEK